MVTPASLHTGGRPISKPGLLLATPPGMESAAHLPRLGEPKFYRPRRPERSPFYAVLHQLFDRFTREYELRFERTFGPLRGIVSKTVVLSLLLKKRMISPELVFADEGLERLRISCLCRREDSRHRGCVARRDSSCRQTDPAMDSRSPPGWKCPPGETAKKETSYREHLGIHGIDAEGARGGDRGHIL